MLSSEERNRIEAEEVFREEIRRQLEARMPAPSRGETLWKALNSSFVLWLLSSVVIASFAWAVARYERSRDEHTKRAEHLARLVTELSFRIEMGIEALGVDAQRIKGGSRLSPFDVYNDGLNYLDNHVLYFGTTPPLQIDYSVYSEYRDRKFRSLLYELRSVAANPTVNDAWHAAETDYKQLMDITSAAQVVTEQQRKSTTNVATITDVDRAQKLLQGIKANLLLRITSTLQTSPEILW